MKSWTNNSSFGQVPNKDNSSSSNAFEECFIDEWSKGSVVPSSYEPVSNNFFSNEFYDFGNAADSSYLC